MVIQPVAGCSVDNDDHNIDGDFWLRLLMVCQGPTGPEKSWKIKKFRPVKVLKLAIGPEKVLIFGQCDPEKLIWPAR